VPAYKPRFTVHYLKSLEDKAGKLSAVDYVKVELLVTRCGKWNNCEMCKLRKACCRAYDKL